MHPPKAIKPFGPQAALLDPTHAGQSALILSLAQSPADATGTIIFLELKLQPSIVV